MVESVSLITNQIYHVPENVDDALELAEFLEKNLGKRIVVVQGLGFVGAVMALVCANAANGDYAVIGVDLPSASSFWKIQSINDGVFPVVADDPNIEELFERSKKQGNLYATCDPLAYRYADVIIVDVNLDVQKTSTAKEMFIARYAFSNTLAIHTSV